MNHKTNRNKLPSNPNQRARRLLAPAVLGAAVLAACAPAEESYPENGQAEAARVMLDQIAPGTGQPKDKDGNTLNIEETIQESLPEVVNKAFSRVEALTQFNGAVGYTAYIDEARANRQAAFVVDENPLDVISEYKKGTDSDTVVYRVRYGVPTDEPDNLGSNVVIDAKSEEPVKELLVFFDKEKGQPKKVEFNVYNHESMPLSDRTEMGGDIISVQLTPDKIDVGEVNDGGVNIVSIRDGESRSSVDNPTRTVVGLEAVSSFLADAEAQFSSMQSS